MARRLAVLLLCLLSATLFAEETYLGLFMQGQKIGYVSSNSEDEKVGAETLTRTDSKTVIKAALLGDAMTMSIFSQTWNDAKGSPRKMKFVVSSAGRTQETLATFTKEAVRIVMDNSGQVSTKDLPIPKDAKIVDDAMATLLAEGLPAGSQRVYYVLDPMTATLVKNTAKLVGPSKVAVKNAEFFATLVEISDPRAVTRVFVSAKGDLIKAESFAGIEMIPLSKEEALAESSAAAKIDLAAATKIEADKPLGDLDALLSSSLKFTTSTSVSVPSDAHQTVRKSEGGWVLDIHPVQAKTNGKTMAQIGGEKAAFLQPSQYIPSESQAFKSLAKQVVGSSKSVPEAAGKIQKHVTSIMRGNAGIGILRDAAEVLRTKEGVCRDFAILTATLLRAGGIAARVASGLVYSGDAFYYHAWAEYWDGANWVGLDSTRPSGRVTAGHVKLAHGSVEEAFLFPFLDKPRIQVLNLKSKPASGSKG
jgi:transglutaminase-like putative cysteine protease